MYGFSHICSLLEPTGAGADGYRWWLKSNIYILLCGSIHKKTILESRSPKQPKTGHKACVPSAPCACWWAMGDGFGRTRLSVHTAHASWLSPAAKVFTAAYRFRLSLAAQNLGEKEMKVWGHTGHCSQVVYKPSTYLEIMFYELNNICHHVHPSFH